MSEQSTERWGIVEVMGHRVVAGRLGAQDPPYTSGIVVHVPMPDGGFAEEFYGGAALFGVRVVPEAVARRAAASSYHVSELAKALGQAALPAPEAEKRPSLEGLHAREARREEIYREIDDRLDGRDEGEDSTMPAEGWLSAIEARVGELRDSVKANEGDERDAQLALAETVLAAILSLDRQAEDKAAADMEEDEDLDDVTPPDAEGDLPL